MAVVATTPKISGSTVIYDAHIGRELTDEQLYRSPKARLRERTRISEYLRTIEQQFAIDYQLRMLQGLRKNWNSYNADPPNPMAFDGAHRIIAKARYERIDVTRLVPSAEGGVGVCFVSGNRYAHIEASNDGELALVMFSGNNPAQISEIKDEPELVEALHSIRKHLNI
jgi:hypothetical protein